MLDGSKLEFVLQHSFVLKIGCNTTHICVDRKKCAGSHGSVPEIGSEKSQNFVIYFGVLLVRKYVRLKTFLLEHKAVL